MNELMGELVRLGFLLTLWAFGIWVGGASVAAWVAWERGREPVAWFVLAFFLSPLVALTLSAVPARHLARARAARAAALGELRRLKDPLVVAAQLVNDWKGPDCPRSARRPKVTRPDPASRWGHNREGGQITSARTFLHSEGARANIP